MQETMPFTLYHLLSIFQVFIHIYMVHWQTYLSAADFTLNLVAIVLIGLEWIVAAFAHVRILQE